MSQSATTRIRDAMRGLGYAVRFFGQSVRVHPSSWISAGSSLRVQGGGSIAVGRNCELHPMTLFMTYGGEIVIGDDCSFNPFTVVYGHGGVRIGNGVRIACHTVIIPANHSLPTDGTPVRLAPVSARGIDIMDNVWIGAGARILDGVRIGANAVVGAGCVVTHDVPANATVAGVPGRVIRQR